MTSIFPPSNSKQLPHLLPDPNLFNRISYVKNLCSFAIIFIRVSFALRWECLSLFHIIPIPIASLPEWVISKIQISASEPADIDVAPVRCIAIEEHQVSSTCINRHPVHVGLDVASEGPVQVLRQYFPRHVAAPHKVQAPGLSGVGVDRQQDRQEGVQAEGHEGRLVLVRVETAAVGELEVDLLLVQNCFLAEQLGTDVADQAIGNLAELFEKWQEVLHAAQKTSS